MTDLDLLRSLFEDLFFGDAIADAEQFFEAIQPVLEGNPGLAACLTFVVQKTNDGPQYFKTYADFMAEWNPVWQKYWKRRVVDLAGTLVDADRQVEIAIARKDAAKTEFRIAIQGAFPPEERHPIAVGFAAVHPDGEITPLFPDTIDLSQCAICGTNDPNRVAMFGVCGDCLNRKPSTPGPAGNR